MGAMRRGRALAAAVAVALVAVVAAACGDDAEPAVADGPIAAVQDDHLPVDPIETIPERVRLIAETGVTTTRVDLFWRDIAPSEPQDPRDPADPAYDWTRADLIMNELDDAGIDPIVSTFNTPDWATDGPPLEEGVAVSTATPRPQQYADFVAAVAARYSGEFTPAGADEPLPAVRRFELWNEPNLGGFLRPQVDEAGERVAIDAYAEMVKAAYPAAKEANPDAIIIAGVAGPRSSSSESGTGAMDWLRGLAAADVPLDAYSQHIYPAAPPTVDTDVVPSWATVDVLLEELGAFGEDVPLYITEAGYTTATTPFRDTRVTEEEQAQYLTEIYSLPGLSADRVPVIVWFNLQDNRNWPAGLYREDLTQKPSYERFTEVVDAQDGARLG